MGRIQVSGRGRRRLLRGHPWVYADDVAAGEGEPGELLPVAAPDGSPLGWGLFSSRSRIAVRMVTRSPDQPDRAFWERRVRDAVEARRRLGYLVPGGAARLVHGDADGLPGLVADLYADVLVLQSTTQGADRMRALFAELLEEALGGRAGAVFERSDASVRRHEGLESRVEWLRGDPLETVEVREEPQANGAFPPLVYEVALLAGHKTGAYLDQRENRIEAARHAAGADVLDAFAYDGLFGIRAALAGARSVTCVEQSEAALERCRRNAERNGVASLVRVERANAMHELRRREQEGKRFDLVVCDPPAFARKRSEVEGALRGYRELHRRGLALVREGGVLVAASCSHNVGRESFVRTVAEASLLAGRPARLFRLNGAAPDHPVLATLPESGYLDCVFVRPGAPAAPPAAARQERPR